MKLPIRLQSKLDKRKEANAIRVLGPQNQGVDFSSNDYLHFAASAKIYEQAHAFLTKHLGAINGATGSRLLTGNHLLYELAENHLAKVHQEEAALIFNSGYDANIGFYAAVPQRGDVILYDAFSHASIRDGIQLSQAKAYKFNHNDLDDLEEKLRAFDQKREEATSLYIVTESVFSMDGDSPDIVRICALAENYNALVVIDEAHALGVVGDDGYGLVQSVGLHEKVFARIMTFGKALGGHGAAILGSEALRDYLINFSRSFIYTTGLTPHSVASIYTAYHYLEDQGKDHMIRLQQNIAYFRQAIRQHQLHAHFIDSQSAIHCCVIPGNDRVKTLARQLQQEGFDVRPILSPTVAAGQERLRFCLHSNNSALEIDKVLALVRTFVV